ncbi:MAG: DUF2723 domain-containing protein [Chloroflexota bacterium]|nr:MAG: DUF2723 domain-containing protein [Chloroflexota bacterium]
MVTSDGPAALVRPVRSVSAGLGRWVEVGGPLLVAIAVLALVWPGLLPGVAYWDTGEFQTILPIMGTAHPTGYPTYVLLGWISNLLLAPIGEPAFRMNVLSLLCVAAAGGLTVHLVRRLSGHLALGVAAGLAVALGPASWRLATHADPHTLHLAFVAALFVLLVRWEQAHRSGSTTAGRWLVGASVVFGLSVGNHSLTLLLAAPVGLYVLSVQPGILLRPRLVAVCALAVVGTVVAVYLELPLRAGPFRAPLVYGKPDTWDGFWYVALAEQFRGSLVDPLGDLPRKLADLARLASAEFGYLTPIIPVAFVATAVRQWRYALLSGSAMAITVVFNASYVNADISRYYLGPSLWAWTWLAILAGVIVELVAGPAPEVDDPVPGRGTSSPEPGDPSGTTGGTARPAVRGTLARLASSAVALSLAGLLALPTATDLSGRAEVADSSHDTSAQQWVSSVLAEAAPDAVIVSWWSASTVLWYAQFVEHRRPDVTVIDDRTRLDLDYGEATDVIARFLGSRPVYVIRANDHDLQLVRDLFDIVPVGSPTETIMYRVRGLRGAGG